MSSPKKSKIKFSAIIIGLGNIGFGYDIDKPKYVFTHSRAYLGNKNINLVAGVDIKLARRKMFSRATNVKAYRNIAEFKKSSKERVDIVSICTPTAAHYQSIRECLGFGPKVIVLEKPISANIKEAREIVKLCRQNKIGLYVNYWRRVDPFFGKVKKIIAGKNMGELLFGIICYSGGLYNNGSHFIDLLNFWLDNGFKKVNYSASGNFGLQYGSRAFHFQTSAKFGYGLTECDLFFDKGRIRCLDSDLSYEIYKNGKDPYFKGFYTLKKAEAGPISSLLKYQAAVLTHIIDYLNGRTALCSTGGSALKTLEIIEKIKR